MRNARMCTLWAFQIFCERGEQGSAKGPPKGSRSFADCLCRGCPSKSQGKKPRPTKNFERKSKPEPFTHQSVRHPREFQVWLSELRCRAEGLATRPESRVSSLATRHVFENEHPTAFALLFKCSCFLRFYQLAHDSQILRVV